MREVRLLGCVAVMLWSCGAVMLWEKAIEIAKGMKKDKEPIEKIMKYKGLTKEEIGKIK